MEIYIIVDYLRRVEEKEWAADSNRIMVNYEEVFVAGLKVAIPYKRRSM